jgi:hypothetical protein
MDDGNYVATIPAQGISDAAGNTPGTDYQFNFFVLSADANYDRIVDIKDLRALAQNWQQAGRTFSQGDFNYDGVVDSSDLGLLARNWQVVLDPVPAPTSLFSITTLTARRTATSLVTDVVA